MQTLAPFAISLCLALATEAQAQGAQTASSLSDEQVRRMIGLALDHITRARCTNSQFCVAATAEEKANPPITVPEARLALNRGLLSAMAQHCDLDWHGRNFAPMMSYWRNTVKKSERQAALLGMLHGIMQGMAKPDAKVGPCTSDGRQNVDKQLAFRP